MPPAAGMVLHDDGRIAGDVVDDVARERARIEVVAAAHRRAHDQAELLALVEGGDVILRGADAGRQTKRLPARRRTSSFTQTVIRGRQSAGESGPVIDSSCPGDDGIALRTLRRRRRLRNGGGCEQSSRAAAAVAPSEPRERVPDHGLVAGDDRAAEPAFELLDDAEDGNIGAAQEIDVGVRTRGGERAVAPDLRRRRAIGVAAGKRRSPWRR